MVTQSRAHLWTLLCLADSPSLVPHPSGPAHTDADLCAATLLCGSLSICTFDTELASLFAICVPPPLSRPASTPPAGPVEIPKEFRSQRLRHKEYKRRGPASGSRFDEEEIGETRTALASSFFDASEEGTSAPSAPPPPPPPPPPSSAVPERAGLLKRREAGKERTEAVPGPAPAAAGAAATETPEEGETGTARAREAGVISDGEPGGAAIEPRTGADNAGGGAATENATNILEENEKACAGGKRKVGPGGREEGKGESPRKSADYGGPSRSDAVGNSGHSVGEDSAGVGEGAGGESPARKPREGKGEGAGLQEGSSEDCGRVGGGADDGRADIDGGRKTTPRP